MRKVTDNFGLIVILAAIVIFCSACGSKGAAVKTDSAAIEAELLYNDRASAIYRGLSILEIPTKIC